MARYIKTKLFNRAAAKIAALKPCPFAGVVTVDQVKLALGECLDIWPESIAPFAESAEIVPFPAP
jgi:predicted amidohydrolase